MAIDWATSYEAPTGLDAQRVIGTHGRRATLWTLAGCAGALPLIVALIGMFLADLIEPLGVPTWLPKIAAIVLGFPTGIWIMVCYTLGSDWGGRPFEYWFRAWKHHVRMPKSLIGDDIQKYHVIVKVENHRIIDEYGNPSAVLEASNINLRMADSDTLGAHIQRWHGFLVGLRFPIQIVVRAWFDDATGTVRRRWFVALSAESDDLLTGRIEATELNGSLYESLQACWSIKPGTSLGPNKIERDRYRVFVDGEWVRGHMLRVSPRVFDVNWLAGLLDGDNPVDMSMWLDPIENADEAERLNELITGWESSQILSYNKKGYREPDIDDQIRDAKVTRAALRKPGMLRVFFTSIGFAVRAADDQTLRDREALLLDQLRENCGQNPTIPLDYEQDRAVLLGVPMGYPPVQLPLRIVSPALARTHPFSNSSLNMPGGVGCGTSKDSRRENYLNVWILTNPHIIIPATTGSGKGYWVKVYLWRLMQMFPDRRVWIIQAEKDEYTALAESMSMYEARDTPDPQPIYSVEQPEVELLMHPRFRKSEPKPRGCVIRITDPERADELLFEEPPAWAPWEKRRLAGSQLTVYDLTRLKQDEKGAVIARILELLDQDAASEPTPTLGHILVDELGIIQRSRVAMDAIDTAWRRFRSIPHVDDPKKISRRGMIGITQRPSDLLADPRGPAKVLVDLSATRVYFREEDTELAVTAKNLRLTPDEVTYLAGAAEGDGMLVAARSRVAFHLDASTEEDEIART
jgi:hypothetical protein